jgi:hypothetical protein
MAVRVHTFSDSSASSGGHVLIEALLSLAVIGLGAMPLAMLGSTWLRWAGEQERMIAALAVAVELAEGGVSGLPAPDKHLAVVDIEHRSSVDAPGIAALPTRLALWVKP